MNDDDKQKSERIRQMNDVIPPEWDTKPLSLAHEIMGFLEGVKDAGTHIDSGTDGTTGDLWVKVQGIEYLIQVGRSLRQQIEDRGGEQGDIFEYGVIRERWGDFELITVREADPKQIKKYLHHVARSKLPPGSRYELRAKFPTDFGRGKGMAWYHHPSMTAAPEWVEGDIENLQQDLEAGFFLLGRYVTPAATPGPIPQEAT